ncbi:MAG: phage portal protein [Pseudomonadota bacterium]
MGSWSDWFFGRPQPSAVTKPAIQAQAQGQMFSGLDDPALLEFIRNGTSGGISPRAALRTACVLRCVDLLSSSLAMLPARLMDSETQLESREHPLHQVIRWEPNDNHTAFEFFKLMEVRRLMTGDAYAYIVRGVGGRPIALQPLESSEVHVEELPDWSFRYSIQRADGQVFVPPSTDILHVRDLSLDGMVGEGRIKLANEAMEIARAAERAQLKIFDNGMMSGGALSHPQKLAPEAYERLKSAMEQRYSGTENAGRWMVLEEGMKAERFTMTGQEAQTVEARNHQIEDIARAFGVPRPLLMMDDTSWGSGIEQLAILFVRFGLNPGIVAWEQAMRRSLLTSAEKRQYTIDIDEKELLRGTMSDQAEFFAKALGSGGHAPWMEQNEVREATGFGPHEDGVGLKQMGTTNDTQPEAA